MTVRIRTGSLIRRALFGLLVTGIVLFATFPLYYAVITSFKSGAALFRVDYLPRAIDWQNYIDVFREQPFGRNILNSVVVATTVVAAGLLLSLTAAYALARQRFRGRRLLLLTLLAVTMFPQVAVLSGLFELVRAFGLYNRLSSLGLSYMLFTLPFSVWILTTFLRELPRELEEAAIMDGASPLTILLRVFAPLMGPAVVTTVLLAFIAAWNEFLFAHLHADQRAAHRSGGHRAHQRCQPARAALGADHGRFGGRHGAACSARAGVPAPDHCGPRRRCRQGLGAGTETLAAAGRSGWQAPHSCATSLSPAYFLLV